MSDVQQQSDIQQQSDVQQQKDIRAIIAERIQNTDIQNGIVDVFVSYHQKLQDILTVATVENNGVRPEGLTNEIYACFHHIGRVLLYPESDIKHELKTAHDSHLKRATLDSYKIAINTILEQEAKFREIVDYFILVDNFSKYVPDGFQHVKTIREKSGNAKEYYQKAKACESQGEFSQAIEFF